MSCQNFADVNAQNFLLYLRLSVIMIEHSYAPWQRMALSLCKNLYCKLLVIPRNMVWFGLRPPSTLEGLIFNLY